MFLYLDERYYYYYYYRTGTARFKNNKAETQVFMSKMYFTFGKMANEDGGKALYVPNECLTYIDHYRNNSSQDNLKKTVLNFFTGDEILLAKDVLWANVRAIKKFVAIAVRVFIKIWTY